KAMTSSWSLSLTLTWMNTLPSATTGEPWPSPSGARQRTLSSSFHGETFSGDEPSRLGPSHCGQSPAMAVAAMSRKAAMERNRGMGGSPLLFGGEEGVQWSIAPVDAMCVGQRFQAAQVLLGDLIAGFLIGRIAVVDAAAEWTRLPCGAQVVLLEGTEIGRHRRFVGRCVRQEHIRFEIAEEQGVAVF